MSRSSTPTKARDGGFPGGSAGEGVHRLQRGFYPWVGEDPLEGEAATHSSTLAWGNAVDGPWGHKGADRTQPLSLSPLCLRKAQS